MIDPELYGGRHIAYISNYLTRDHPLYALEHDDLLREYVPYLRKINPEFDPSWIETSYHHRIDGAQPVIGTHYSSRIPTTGLPSRVSTWPTRPRCTRRTGGRTTVSAWEDVWPQW